MNPLFIALNALDQSNVEKLYQFELKNRIFFEKTIATWGDYFYTEKGFKAHLIDCFKKEELIQAKHFIIFDEKKDQILGRANIKLIDNKNNYTEIGYRIAEYFQGQGVATKAACFLKEFILNELKITRIQAEASSENIASQKILEKIGFKKFKFLENLVNINYREISGFAYQFTI